MKTIGIDLGTTHSLVSSIEDGFPLVLADENGDRLTPSVVCFPTPNRTLVGWPARRQALVDPGKTIQSIKRVIGRRYSELEAEDRQLYEPDAEGRACRRMGERLLSPEEVSAIILKRLKAIAEHRLEEAVDQVVITVPAYFHEGQRQATARAAELAGLTVRRMINEPTAAALAYGLDKLKERSRVAVFDLGGGTFDLSILELKEDVFQVLATHGHTRLGGDDIDRAFLGMMLPRIEAEFGPIDPHQMARLQQALYEVKHRLSDEKEAELALPFFSGGRGLQMVCTREELEDASLTTLSQLPKLCQKALKDAQCDATSLDRIVLVGGTTRIPRVRELVEEIFGQAPYTGANPDETVAVGAAIQAGILDGRMRDVVLLDVTPLSLGIETYGGLFNVLIPRNSTIPTKAGELFTNAVAGQKEMLVHVLQGEREVASANWSLGKFPIDFTPGPRGSARVGVQFRLDENGMLEVLVRDTIGGQERVASIESAIDVTDEAVEAMLADSLEHALEDYDQRRLVELELKAREMLKATGEALELVRESTPEAEVREIEALCAQANKLLDDSRVGGTRAADLEQIQNVLNALDASTQSLATRVLEQLL
ncbi:MAG: Hsp70 family protein [Verrucomicrobiales bacterium]